MASFSCPCWVGIKIANATLAIRAVEAFQRCHERLAQSESRVLCIDSDPARIEGREVAGSRPALMARASARFMSMARSRWLRPSPFIESVSPGRLQQPVIAIVGVPRDRDYAGVYRVMARISRSLIITETDINPNTRFPAPEELPQRPRAPLCSDVSYTGDLPRALALARTKSGGETGTILLAVSLMLVGECMLIWDVDTTVI